MNFYGPINFVVVLQSDPLTRIQNYKIRIKTHFITRIHFRLSLRKRNIQILNRAMAELSVSDSVTVSDLNSQEQPVLNSAAAAGSAVPPPQNTNELEEKKRRLLEELESALVSPPIPKPVHKPNPKPNRLGLGIEVIDETALLDSIPKIGKQSRRRASKKIHKKAVTVTETETESSIHLVARNTGSSSSSSSENERKYSREEMEAIRFVNVSQQRKFWKKIYDALQSTFSGEYDALVAAPNNPPPFVPNKKPILIGQYSILA